jgi:23S rRNA (cytosine1962-C5)-methyltransferase
MVAPQILLADGWRDYQLLDTGGGMKLERWGDAVLARPDPQVIWPRADGGPWEKWDGWYHRSETGGGRWEFRRALQESWTIGYGGLTFKIRPTDFKHTGLFPEQAVNWDWCAQKISAARKAGREVSVLNLFGYTGAATVACADDCLKFTARETRRGRRYDAIILDPPTYGRGAAGEMWKIEEDLWPLLVECRNLLSERPLFLLINSYASKLSPLVLANMLTKLLSQHGGRITVGELGLPSQRDGMILPCGICGRWETA